MDVKYVAHLARLELTADEEQRFAAQLDGILEFFEQLKRADVSAVEPMAHAMPLVNVTRPDAVQPSLPHADALANAPARSGDLFSVPKIVE
jgi:aspartyl-tRNA(Asn)/glutamyl-tRNA(Gln) amidotransferase subunit C